MRSLPFGRRTCSKPRTRKPCGQRRHDADARTASLQPAVAIASTPHRPQVRRISSDGPQAPCVPVFRQLTGDGLTPVSAFRRIERTAPSFPLRERDRRREGRPIQLPRHRALPDVRGAGARRSSSPGRGSPGSTRRFASADPFQGDLERSWPRLPRAVQLPGLPRFAGGAVGYASYDAVRYTEHPPRTSPPTIAACPTSRSAFYDRMPLFDHIRKTILVVAHAPWVWRRPSGGLRPRLRGGSTRWRGAARRGPARRAGPSATSTPTGRSRLRRGRISARAGSTRRSSGTVAGITSRRATSSRSCRASGSSVETTAEAFNIYRVSSGW